MTHRLLLCCASLLLCACTARYAPLAEVREQLDASRPAALTCVAHRADRCATPTLLTALDGGDVHHVIPLDIGAEALAARVHLIRSARHSLEIQNYIFLDDDSSRVLLHELVGAARRGVRVRILVDALFSFPDLDLLAVLVRAHERLEVRLYNPVRGYATLPDRPFLSSIACCFRTLNHRLHAKLFIADGRFGILGGRNSSDRYFDLDTRMNFRDFDALVAGPEVRVMQASFDRYWWHRRSVPAWQTRDLGRVLLTARVAAWPQGVVLPERALALARRADDASWQQQRLLARAMAVESLQYFDDPPDKPWLPRGQGRADSTTHIHDTLARARRRVVLQSPYFVVSPRFRRVLQNLPEDLDFRVSTNSLASTDAFPVYGIQHRQRDLMLQRLGLRIFEFKPYPADRHRFVPRYPELIREKAAGITSPMRGDPIEATRAMPGPRISVHAKLIVIDGETVIITSHNFDPRSEFYNTENGIVVRDRALAAHLTAQIETDMAAPNAWVVAPRHQNTRGLGALDREITVFSRRLPTLDLWPRRYTRNYQLTSGGESVAWWHPDFFDQHEPVDDFPDVVSGQRRYLTRFISRMLGFVRPLM